MRFTHLGFCCEHMNNILRFHSILSDVPGKASSDLGHDVNFLRVEDIEREDMRLGVHRPILSLVNISSTHTISPVYNRYLSKDSSAHIQVFSVVTHWRTPKRKVDEHRMGCIELYGCTLEVLRGE